MTIKYVKYNNRCYQVSDDLVHPASSGIISPSKIYPTCLSCCDSCCCKGSCCVDMTDVSPGAIEQRKLKSFSLEHLVKIAVSGSEECPSMESTSWEISYGEKIEWEYAGGTDMSSCFYWDVDGAGITRYYSWEYSTNQWTEIANTSLSTVELSGYPGHTEVGVILYDQYQNVLGLYGVLDGCSSGPSFQCPSYEIGPGQYYHELYYYNVQIDILNSDLICS